MVHKSRLPAAHLMSMAEQLKSCGVMGQSRPLLSSRGDVSQRPMCSGASGGRQLHARGAHSGPCHRRRPGGAVLSAGRVHPRRDHQTHRPLPGQQVTLETHSPTRAGPRNPLSFTCRPSKPTVLHVQARPQAHYQPFVCWTNGVILLSLSARECSRAKRNPRLLKLVILICTLRTLLA